MRSFAPSWAALLSAVDGLSDDAFARPSGCRGWLVRDLVTHLVIDAQDVLITLATPTAAAATHDAITYWDVGREPPSGDDPLDALIVRLAAAYEEPWLLRHHFDDLGSAAGRAAELADPESRVTTQGQVLTAGDYLSAYVVESTLHHLDLIAHLEGVAGPPESGLSLSRTMLERIGRLSFPVSFSDEDALLVGTGRRPVTPAEEHLLGDAHSSLPLVLG